MVNKEFNLNEFGRLAIKQNLEKTFEMMLVDMKIDRNDPHFAGTPERMARMYVDEIFRGLYHDEPKITTFPNDTTGQMVFLGNIDLFSTCGHHFKTFAGKAHIAYIPDKELIGISKLARITDWFARRPQVQENLTSNIADYIVDKIRPIGCGVMIEAIHNCVRVRGAKQSSSVMQTTALRGNFYDDKVTAEFYRNIDRLK